MAILTTLSAGVVVAKASQTTKSAKKSPVTHTTAAHRLKSKSSAATLARDRSRRKPVSSSLRHATRVVVTRKKVNGKWVRVSHVIRVVPPAPSYQAQPDADRFQQIQQALTQRGFFKGETNGQWGPDSVDALKQFQAANGLSNEGKINSLSLIGLGLGPKHDGSSAADPAVPVASSVPPAEPGASAVSPILQNTTATPDVASRTATTPAGPPK